MRCFPNPFCNYVCDVMYVSGLGGFCLFLESFCGQYNCPNVFVFLVYRGIWRCDCTIFCVEIAKRHEYIFIHSFIQKRKEQTNNNDKTIYSEFSCLVLSFILLVFAFSNTVPKTFLDGQSQCAL